MSSPQNTKLYDRKFFAWQETGSTRSARQVLGIVNSHVTVSSVVDVGCGTGGWLKVWQELGINDVAGIDGAHIADDQLHIAPSAFERHDLSKPWALSRRFDLAQSLEVAEHLARDAGPQFVHSLCSLSDVVLFSAAQPGQGGEFHVNERPLAYWQALFEAQGYRTFDGIRHRIGKEADVQMWYRHNTLLFANAAGRERLSEELLADDHTSAKLVTSYGDWLWELRRLVLRFLPVSFITRFSKFSYPLKIRFNDWQISRSEGRLE